MKKSFKYLIFTGFLINSVAYAMQMSQEEKIRLGISALPSAVPNDEVIASARFNDDNTFEPGELVIVDYRRNTDIPNYRYACFLESAIGYHPNQRPYISIRLHLFGGYRMGVALSYVGKITRSTSKKEDSEEAAVTPDAELQIPNVSRTVYIKLTGVDYFTSAVRILGVSPHASKGQIKKAYMELAIKWHPDKNADPDTAEIFKLITWAYKALTGS